jgi:hypothetical protein
MIFSRLAVLIVGVAVSVQGHAIEIEKRVPSKQNIRPNPSNGRWVDAWATMPQLTEPANLPPAPFVCLLVRTYHSFALTHHTEPNRRSLCELHSATDFVHDYFGQTNSSQVL